MSSNEGLKTSDPLTPRCEKHDILKKRKFAYGKACGWVCKQCHAEYCRGRYISKQSKQKQYENFLRWKNKNLERRREISREWERNNPENSDRRRKRKLNAKGSHTIEQRILKYIFWGEKCAYCKKELNFKKIHWDHVIPLVRGGTNFISNMRPACGFCNASKGSKPLFEWKQLSSNIWV